MERNRTIRTLLLAGAGVLAYVVGFFSTTGAAPAQTAKASTERFDMKVREDFFAGLSGNRERLTRGMKVCEEALTTDAKNSQALVWHGAGTFYLSGEAFQSGDQAKGIEMWSRGLKEMQTAVDLAPDDLGTRIPRGAALLTGARFAPEEMAKPPLRDGLSDFEHVYEIQKPYFATLGSHPRGELLFGMAEGYSRSGNVEKAKMYFEQIAKDLPNTAYAKRADLWLTTKSIPANQTGCVGCHVSK